MVRFELKFKLSASISGLLAGASATRPLVAEESHSRDSFADRFHPRISHSANYRRDHCKCNRNQTRDFFLRKVLRAMLLTYAINALTEPCSPTI
ncbi:hypothetical protein CEXT_93781 [Caerostris extrusa]|uniref:Secreted protein n=1 Tax=Caerostris extrusa TaxID=172846 RepID=A0AAV4PBS9_CAEEX|nr:hypothetical protein CEXT_93781 [Caerostris extrusa]